MVGIQSTSTTEFNIGNIEMKSNEECQITDRKMKKMSI